MINLSNRVLYSLIGFTILINFAALFSPILNSNDAYFYAIISKNIVNSNNWIDLVYNGKDWLDKPHLPFWLTSLSFKLLGVNTFSYVLPGFLFNLIGAYYTYKLAKALFNNHSIGILASLIYLTSLHLLLSSIDVRAEAYLLGEIMPAVYYLIKYTKAAKYYNLILASFFIALALMTKGLFILLTVYSGVFITLTYLKEYFKLFKLLLISLSLSFIFALPEFVSLYLQFDSHPEKLVFSQHNVSGIEWFFWGSQFGRFFNTGPIINTQGNLFYFMHTFLWAMLPWSLVFILSVFYRYKTLNLQVKSALIFLYASFLPTFILFSLTKFQLDHYTNIVFPSIAILIAYFLAYNAWRKLVTNLLQSVSIIILVLGAVLAFFVFKLSGALVIYGLILIVLMVLSFKIKQPCFNLIALPVISINLIFGLLIFINMKIYTQYDLGYQVNHRLNLKPNLILYNYQVPQVDNSLNFHTRLTFKSIDNLNQLTIPSYVVVLKENLKQFNNYQFIELGTYNSIPMTQFIGSLLSKAKYSANIRAVVLIKLINPRKECQQ